MFRKIRFIASVALAAGLLGGIPMAAQAAEKEPPVTLNKCDKAIGSVAPGGWRHARLDQVRAQLSA